MIAIRVGPAVGSPGPLGDTVGGRYAQFLAQSNPVTTAYTSTWFLCFWHVLGGFSFSCCH